MADITASDDTLDDVKDDDTPEPYLKPPKGSTASLSPNSAKLARKWSTELQASKKWMSKFVERARKCEKAYLDDGDGGATRNTPRQHNGSRVNIFWANVQVTLAAIYGRLPKASVDRKFKDFDDDISRVAAVILERILNADLDDDEDDLNPAMRDAVQDRFITGMGQVWCRYDVETEQYDAPVLDPMTGQAQIDPTTQQPVTSKQERILSEEACTDYVYWEDFRYSPCRRWRDCRWVARAVLMSEDRINKRFKLTPAQAGTIPYRTRDQGDSTDVTDTDVAKATPFKQARVWEIWEKESNQVCWYCEGCTFVLDYADDILQLDGFFPCPKPILATTLTKAFIPKADFVMAQDLYEELDVINNRLAALERAIKAVGVRDKNARGVEKMLTEGIENDLVPVENWSAFAEKGGLKGAIDFLPIDAFVNAVTQLTQRKATVQKDLYELLGLSDIMRGATVASETATAQELKAQYGGARLATLQMQVSKFIAEIMRIRANIVANHFQPDTIKRLSMIDKTPDAAMADQAIQLLKQWGIAQHQVTVDADSLAAPDWEQEKQTRTEFMGAISNYIMAAAPLLTQTPAAGQFLLRMLQWGTAGFKGAAAIEGVVDQAIAQFEQQAKAMQQAQQTPTPEDQKKTAEAQEAKAKGDKASAQAAGQQQANQMVQAAMQQHHLVPVPGIPPMGGGPPGAMGPGGPPPGMPPGMPPPGGPPPLQPPPGMPGTMVPSVPHPMPGRPA